MKRLIIILLVLGWMMVGKVGAVEPLRKIVGVYQGAPGTLPIVLANGNRTWVTNFPGHPTLGEYDTASEEYINWSFDKMVELGIDFIVLDESNGIHLIAGNGERVLEAALLKYLDIADSRISRGVATPKITLMTPIIGLGDSCGARQQGTQDGCLIGEADWIWEKLVNKDGKPRPSWFQWEDKPFLGIYSVRPFTPTFVDDRYTIRHICNAQSNECHQPQKDMGNVWFWTTRFESGPLYSTKSEEVTIQNGFSNKVACEIWGLGNDPSCLIYEGFTAEYYKEQWDKAVSFKPQIIMITNFGGGAGLEGGQIEQRTDFVPPTLYEDITKEKVFGWKMKAGDTNNDQKVDLLDFSIWKQEYLKRVNTLRADFNGDGKVDLLDFAIWKRGYTGG